MLTERLLSLLQFSDGLFPAGAYAHSHGLETYVHSGLVRNAADAQEFLLGYLHGSIASCDCPAAVAALRAAGAHNLEGCLELDGILDAIKPAAEAREASRQLGRQSLRVAVGLLNDSLTSAFLSIARAGRTPCHHAIAFGIIGAAEKWEPEELAQSYLYSSATAVASAALRLIPLGQVQAQQLIRGVLPELDYYANRALDIGVSELSSFAPCLEVAAMRHERLGERLFRS